MTSSGKLSSILNLEFILIFNIHSSRRYKIIKVILLARSESYYKSLYALSNFAVLVMTIKEFVF